MEKRRVAILDTTMRDGQHAMAHQFTPEQVANVARALDEAGVGTIEISHGDGLAGSSIQYGFAAADDFELLKAASEVTTPGRIGVLLLPGVGTQEDLQMAKECGAGAARVATHCTEADIAEQHIELAGQLGMRPVGVLMMTHMVDPPKLVEQAKIMEASGAELVYMMDSAGAMLPSDVVARVDALKSALNMTSRSASTPTTTCPWPSPTRWPPSRPEPIRSTRACGGWARAPATPSWRS